MRSRLFSSISTDRNRIPQATSLQTQASSSIPAAFRNRMLSSSLKLKPYLTSNPKLNPQLKTMHDQQNMILLNPSLQKPDLSSSTLKLKPSQGYSPQSQFIETGSLQPQRDGNEYLPVIMRMYTQTFFELDNFPYNATYDYSCVTKNCENDS